ncbi:MAG: TetR/AcrR family transcriptional regulator [Pseudomonadota bacterium]
MSKQPVTVDQEPGDSTSLIEQRQQRKHQQIIDAALDVFTRDGFAAARTDAIAEQAGVAKGTLYLYFDSKEAIFREAIRTRMLPVVHQMRDETEQFEGSAEDLLRMQMRNFYHRVIGSERIKILRLMMAEGSRFPDIAEYYFTNVIQVGMQSLRRTVELGIERGEFRRPASELYPISIAGPALMSGIMRMVFDRQIQIDLDQAYESHLDMVLHALRRS